MQRKTTAILGSIAAVLALVGCSSGALTTAPQDNTAVSEISVVTGSTVVASLVADIAGDNADIVSLVPNSFDAHTYSLKPSEAAAIETADVIFLADAELNNNVTTTAESRKTATASLIDLNQAALESGEFLYINSYRQRGKNPHTWTNLRYTWKWIPVIRDELIRLDPSNEDIYLAKATELQNAINDLHSEIITSMTSIPKEQRKIIVYHDAWEYFGKEYGVEVIGSLQAIDYSDPSPKQLSDIVEQIKRNDVSVFYGSEVFPTDVLERLGEETDADYISDLSDDALPGEVGERDFLYVELMRNNLGLIKQGLE